jgi:hypothetical protein
MNYMTLNQITRHSILHSYESLNVFMYLFYTFRLSNEIQRSVLNRHFGLYKYIINNKGTGIFISETVHGDS